MWVFYLLMSFFFCIFVVLIKKIKKNEKRLHTHRNVN